MGYYANKLYTSTRNMIDYLHHIFPFLHRTNPYCCRSHPYQQTRDNSYHL